MEKGLLHKQIRDFFVRNFDVRQEKEDELETIESIRKGIEFKGTNLWVLIFATFVASLGLNTNSTAVIIGAMLISHGDGIQRHHFDALFPDFPDQRGAERVAGPYAAYRL